MRLWFFCSQSPVDISGKSVAIDVLMVGLINVILRSFALSLVLSCNVWGSYVKYVLFEYLTF